MEKKDYIILVDLDDTVENLLTVWVAWLNREFGFSVDADSIEDFDLTKTFPTLTEEQLYSPLHDPQLWKDVRPLPGAVEALEQLVREGFKVKLCTAASPTSYALKMKYFVKKYLPFINPRTDCICAQEKQLIKGHVLIDDYIGNVVGGDYIGLLFNKSYNEKCAYPSWFRMYNWEEIYKWIEEDFEYAKEVQDG